MRHITTSEARDELSEILNRVAYGRERVVIRRRGKDLAAVISVEDLRRLERLEEALEDKLDAEAADRILADPKAEFVDWPTAKRERRTTRRRPRPKR